MKSEVMARFTEIWLPSTALIIFVSIFLIMLITIFTSKSKENFKIVERLPLNEGSRNE